MTNFFQHISSRVDGNMAFNTIHSPVEATQNREAFAKKQGFSLDRVVGIQQAHTDNIQIVTAADTGKGAREWASAFPATDGLVTKEKDLILLILGADCSLISFYDPVQSVVGLVHSGWQGTAKQIASKMIRLLQSDFSSKPEDIQVSLSPSAGVCCYEVGEDILEQFTSEPCLEIRNRKTYLNVKQTIVNQCLAEGVPAGNIKVDSVCTICDDHYYSFRREAEQAGRFGLWVWQGW